MAIEAGAKNGIFPVDDVTRAYVQDRVDRPWEAVEADPDAEYERTVEIDLDQVDCTVAWPHLPENARSAREGKDVAIDQIVIGSCTNGQLPDMAAAAEILKGRRLAPGVRGIVIPATQESGASPPPTATLWAAWATWTARSIWPPPPWRRPPAWPDISLTLRRC